MPLNDDEFIKRLLEIFRIEATEHIENTSADLIKLEKCKDAKEWDKLTESIFRQIHSLKGASRSVDKFEVQNICQGLESVFKLLREKQLSLDTKIFNSFHSALDILSKLINEEAIDDSQVSDAENLVDQLLLEIESLKNSDSNVIEEDITPKQKSTIDIQPEGAKEKPKTPRKRKSKTTQAKKKVNIEKKTEQEPISQIQNIKTLSEVDTGKEEFVKVSVKKMHNLVLKLEDLVSVKLVEANALDLLNKLREELLIEKKKLKKGIYSDSTINGNYISESNSNEGETLVKGIETIQKWNNTFLTNYENQITSIKSLLVNDFRQNTEKIDGVIDELRKVLMLPFSTVLNSFPKMVRDIATDEGKQIKLEISGEEIEVDKRILDELKDPFTHILRNSIDHGIELPETRVAKGKETQGLISIEVSHKLGNKIEILISDDGRGIDINNVVAKAISAKIIDRAGVEELSAAEKLQLIFESGISTSAVVTDLSGRGLGLAIVKEKIEYLGGNISIETNEDAGTTFKLKLPASLTSFRGIIVVSNKRNYIFPTSGIEKVIRISVKAIKTAENKNIISLDKKSVPVFHLNELLMVKNENRVNKQQENYTVLLVGKDKPIGILVDTLVREQEIMIKDMGSQLKKVVNVMGTTILGDGSIAPILYIPDLIKNAGKSKSQKFGGKDTKGISKKVRILIAEDSITSRMLLVNILETAGYEVVSTIDGAEAYQTLREEKFDVVVSDVEMPNMNGFELTKKIKENEKYKSIPVILVTALKSRADKEMGMDVGADAYIIKSSFKPETLLSTIKKFS